MRKGRRAGIIESSPLRATSMAPQEWTTSRRARDHHAAAPRSFLLEASVVPDGASDGPRRPHRQRRGACARRRRPAAKFRRSVDLSVDDWPHGRSDLSRRAADRCADTGHRERAARDHRGVGCRLRLCGHRQLRRGWPIGWRPMGSSWRSRGWASRNPRR